MLEIGCIWLLLVARRSQISLGVHCLDTDPVRTHHPPRTEGPMCGFDALRTSHPRVGATAELDPSPRRSSAPSAVLERYVRETSSSCSKANQRCWSGASCCRCRWSTGQPGPPPLRSATQAARSTGRLPLSRCPRRTSSTAAILAPTRLGPRLGGPGLRRAGANHPTRVATRPGNRRAAPAHPARPRAPPRSVRSARASRSAAATRRPTWRVREPGRHARARG